MQEGLGADATVVTIFCDSNKKYLSTGLTHEEPARADHVSNDVELLGFQVFSRVCSTCVGDEPVENPPVLLR